MPLLIVFLNNLLGKVFLFCDKTMSVEIDAEAKKFDNSPFMVPGRFIKIFNPKVKNDSKRLLLGDDSKVLPSGCVEVNEMPSTSGAETLSKGDQLEKMIKEVETYRPFQVSIIPQGKE